MIHMHYFYALLKNNLFLKLGVGCLYSPGCRERAFSEIARNKGFSETNLSIGVHSYSAY
jgi:hypothetical protein